jgi:thiamine biosynthesis lipoprotein
MFKILAALILMAPTAGKVTVREERHMGTYVSITVAAPESPKVLEAIKAGFAEVKRLESILSEWRPSSEISAVNQQAGKKAVKVGKELFHVLEMAKAVSVKSEGAFDVTFGALGGLWNYKAKNPRIPGKQEIEKRVSLVDYRQLVLDKGAQTAMLKKKGMRTGLGGIAKGYIVDRVSAVLKEKGYPNHLVIGGGDLYASGTRGDRKWRIGIRHPKNRELYAAVEIENEGVATSGNYEKFFYKDGVRYHHILDPKTGRPARGTASVTVIAKSAAHADAYATALFVLGPQRALKLAKQEGLEVFIFDESYQTSSTEGVKARLKPVPVKNYPIP